MFSCWLQHLANFTHFINPHFTLPSWIVKLFGLVLNLVRNKFYSYKYSLTLVHQTKLEIIFWVKTSDEITNYIKIEMILKSVAAQLVDKSTIIRRNFVDAISIGRSFRYVGDGLPKSLGIRHYSLCGMCRNGEVRYHRRFKEGSRTV